MLAAERHVQDAFAARAMTLTLGGSGPRGPGVFHGPEADKIRLMIYVLHHP